MFSKNPMIFRGLLLVFTGVLSIVLFTNFYSSLTSVDTPIKEIQKKKIINGVIIDNSAKPISGVTISERKTGKK